MWLGLTRLPPPASRVRRSRCLRDTLAAAPGLLAHACVTVVVNLCPMGPKLRYTALPIVVILCTILKCAPRAEVFYGHILLAGYGGAVFMAIGSAGRTVATSVTLTACNMSGNAVGNGTLVCDP